MGVDNIKKVVKVDRVKRFSLHDSNFERPNPDNVAAALCKMGSESQPGDTCVFYYAGHGNRDSGIPLEGNRCMSPERIRGAIMKNAPTGVKFLVIMECCHGEAQLPLRFKWDAGI